ncbi:NAD-dependent epimerase/dehydratase family protein [Microbacterium jejuense]|uniref:NAD-dependent epimerase/dehydratase family protein n=1 Tax=Microbacterium jejuense TaxID=1263637 RepID=A0ABS7HLP1_9MICO|nr:NAD-dependent epimerase/dehydratase family protein [Microbacterium jejuense]MBW9093871.1 NAD-dependent epimerase/dehydratase family protein [Microbacterium jejuense]
MRAVILGGTGAIGAATAARLAGAGWTVDVTGRSPGSMPDELIRAGVRFHAIDRSDTAAIERLVGAGAELLVDLLAYRAADARALLPVLTAIRSPIVISSRAVYVDAQGRHINGDEAPRFVVPLAESNPTLPPAEDDVDPYTREGYAPSKVAVERVLLDSGLPVTVIRPSKVHGRWARNARTRTFVERMLRGDDVIPLARLGESVDHLTAADNTASLIETVAGAPAARVLNSADPDVPTAAEIVRSIGDALDWHGQIELLSGDDERGANPWAALHPIVLDTSASEQLGYRPVGRGVDLIAAEAHWVVSTL